MDSKDSLTGFLTEKKLPTITRILESTYALNKKPFTILIFDIDHFKRINERFGHLGGDEVLAFFSGQVLRHFAEIEFIPFRLEGETFMLVFPGQQTRQIKPRVDALIRALKKKPCSLKHLSFHISCSAGLADCPSAGATWQSVREAADRALHFSKMTGRGRATEYTHISFLKGLRFLIVTICLVIILVTARVTFWAKGQHFGEPSSGKVTVYLKSGGTIQGQLLEKSGDSVSIQISIGEGYGITVLKRDQIKKISQKK